MLLASSSSSSNSNFLIPNGTFVFELVMFIIVLGVVAKFILPSLQKAMSDRESTIRASLAAGDEGRIEADRLARERASVLEAAHAEARAIVEAASREVERLREEAQARGQQEFEREFASAKSTITNESSTLRDETISKLDEIVVRAAERVIGFHVDPAKHRETIAGAIRRARDEATQ
ncbi:MAG TPA: F0F1 ATP synthase subunit B [Acidimicrobiales bacterium]|nr:F0F1 ATP synthase subunit B [Acidimicrobiales bacterium]